MSVLQEGRDVLWDIRNRGVHLWSENGQLRYKAPKGLLTPREIERLRLHRTAILALLENAADIGDLEAGREGAKGSIQAPLSFSQLAHWYLNKLAEQPAIRQVASATRVHGRLNVHVLSRSLAEVVRRHDSLRTRIVLQNGTPTQQVLKISGCELSVEDLTEIPENTRDAEIQIQIERLVLAPVDISRDSLIGVRLLRLGSDEHVLMVAMEHIVSDIFSLNVFMRELFSAYAQILRGQSSALPELPFQFFQYAIWQRNRIQSWREQHAPYWGQRLVGNHLVRLPADRQLLSTRPGIGWGTASVHIDRALKTKLADWCRVRRTTVAMSVFTAYVALVLRSCGAAESLVLYQSDGRTGPGMENIIGYFATVLYLRIELRESDSFLDLLSRVTSEYCAAYEHADFSYMQARQPRPAFTYHTAFNWIPQGDRLEVPELKRSPDELTCVTVPFKHPMLKRLELDSDPVTLLFESEQEVTGGIHFPLNRFSTDTMDLFADRLLMFIQAMLASPEQRVTKMEIR